MSSLGNDLYAGAAAYGRFQATLGLFLGTIVGVLMVIVGITFVTRAVSLTGKVQGVVSDAQCNQTGTKTDDGKNVRNVYDCQFNIKYKVNNIEHIKHFITHGDAQRFNSELVDVYYNPDHPDDAQLSSDDSHGLGYILIVGGVIFVLACWLWYYIATRYKFAAAAGAVRSIF